MATTEDLRKRLDRNAEALEQLQEHLPELAGPYAPVFEMLLCLQQINVSMFTDVLEILEERNA